MSQLSNQSHLYRVLQMRNAGRKTNLVGHSDFLPDCPRRSNNLICFHQRCRERLLKQNMSSALKGSHCHFVVMDGPTRRNNNQFRLLCAEHLLVIYILPLGSGSLSCTFTTGSIGIRNGKHQRVGHVCEEAIQSMPIISLPRMADDGGFPTAQEWVGSTSQWYLRYGASGSACRRANELSSRQAGGFNHAKRLSPD